MCGVQADGDGLVSCMTASAASKVQTSGENSQTLYRTASSEPKCCKEQNLLTSTDEVPHHTVSASSCCENPWGCVTKNKNMLNFGRLENKSEGISMNPTYICLLSVHLVNLWQATHNNILDSSVRMFSQSKFLCLLAVFRVKKLFEWLHLPWQFSCMNPSQICQNFLPKTLSLSTSTRTFLVILSTIFFLGQFAHLLSLLKSFTTTKHGSAWLISQFFASNSDFLLPKGDDCFKRTDSLTEPPLSQI